MTEVSSSRRWLVIQMFILTFSFQRGGAGGGTIMYHAGIQRQENYGKK